LRFLSSHPFITQNCASFKGLEVFPVQDLILLAEISPVPSRISVFVLLTIFAFDFAPRQHFSIFHELSSAFTGSLQ